MKNTYQIELILQKNGPNEERRITKSEAEIKVFPNPSGGILHFNIEKDLDMLYEIEILDITGKVIYSDRNISTVDTIDLSDQSSGIYFVKFSNERNIIHHQKVILVK